MVNFFSSKKGFIKYRKTQSGVVLMRKDVYNFENTEINKRRQTVRSTQQLISQLVFRYID